MLRYVKTRTSDGTVLKEKMITDNWWGVYHDICVFDWSLPPKYIDKNGNLVGWKDPSKTMVCVDRGKDITVTLTRVDCDDGWNGIREAKYGKNWRNLP